MNGKTDHPELTSASQAIWDQNAAWWDEQVGDGNAFQHQLIGPATERLLAVQPGHSVLDLACGNGLFARRLAQLGAHVVACDFSSAFLDRAKARTTEKADQIDYRLVNLADREQLLGLGVGRYDAAVCGMALMDMAVIAPLLESLPQLLKPQGKFVFSILHPCFNHAGCSLIVEQEDREGALVTTHAVKVKQYLGIKPVQGLGIVGQPSPHYYFHRSLSTLFSACFQAGFVLDGLEEPAFTESKVTPEPSWVNFKDIPPVLVARMRPGKG